MTASDIPSDPITVVSRPTRKVAFWVEWMLANAFGYILGLALCAVLLWPLLIAMGWLSLAVGSVAPIIIAGVAGGVIGSVIGTSQLFVFRLHGLRIPRWILFSAIGAALGLMFSALLQRETWPNNLTSVSYAIIGVTSGAMQWLVLPHSMRRFSLWIVANGIGWTIGPLLSGKLNLGIMYGGFAGAVTGAVLIWLLRQEQLPQVRTGAQRAEAASSIALWFIWVFANSIGVLLTYFMSIVIVSQGFTVLDVGAEVFALLPATGLLLGATLGSMQWSVLRTRLQWAIWWIPANVAGWMIGIAISSSLGSSSLVAALGWTVIGLTIGLAQWCILRNQIRDAIWWIPVSIIGWTISGLLVMRLGPTGALAYAPITGLILAWSCRPQAG